MGGLLNLAPEQLFALLPQPPAPTQLSPEQEQKFQFDMRYAPGYEQWQRQFKQKFGERPNINDPSYDYRLAWQSGIKPQPYEHDQNGIFHWPSVTQGGKPLKQPGHPSAWMEKFMNQYGVDPHEAQPEMYQDAVRRGLLDFWR